MRAIATLAFAVVFTLVAVSAHAQVGFPGMAKNKCLAGKTKCVTKKMQGLLKCREKCQTNPNNCGQKQVDCEDRVRFKFERPDDPTKGCFAKLEAKENPDKPDTICITTGDTAALEAQVDAAVADLLLALESLVCIDVGGFCWYAGADDESCDDVCTGLSLAYDDAGTRGYAGSDGTIDNCFDVLEALGVGSGPVTPTACPTGLGCGVSGSRLRCSAPATSGGGSASNVSRACACL